MFLRHGAIRSLGNGLLLRFNSAVAAHTAALGFGNLAVAPDQQKWQRQDRRRYADYNHTILHLDFSIFHFTPVFRVLLKTKYATCWPFAMGCNPTFGQPGGGDALALERLHDPVPKHLSQGVCLGNLHPTLPALRARLVVVRKTPCKCSLEPQKVLPADDKTSR